MTEPRAYPLTWPQGRPRKRPEQRKDGKFGTRAREFGRSYSTGKPLTMSQAISRVQEEVDRLGGLYPLLSTDVPTRLDGLPRSGAGEPADPGAVLYFQLDGRPYALACDTYTMVAQNVAAIAAHIEAMRAMTRHGVATAAETLQAFQALPGPDTAPTAPGASSAPAGAAPWWSVLNVQREAALEVVDAAYRALAKSAHPDNGGTAEAMAQLNKARDDARREKGA
jgi:hypothetical protein